MRPNRLAPRKKALQIDKSDPADAVVRCRRQARDTVRTLRPDRLLGAQLPDCPLEVLELRTAIQSLDRRSR
jgi:hypothetical protein